MGFQPSQIRWLDRPGSYPKHLRNEGGWSPREESIHSVDFGWDIPPSFAPSKRAKLHVPFPFCQVAVADEQLYSVVELPEL